MSAPPLKASLAGSPSTAVFRNAIGALWDYVTGLLGADGTPAAARAALGVPASTDFSATAAASGVDKGPTGIIDQWTTVTTLVGGDISVGFPVTFPTACYNVTGTAYTGGTTNSVTVCFGVPTAAGVNVSAFNSVTGARVAAAVYIRAKGK